jgi:hypothetical protein
MTSPQPQPTPADLIRYQLREIAETWTDDDGEVDLINLNDALDIVSTILGDQPTVTYTYQQRMETR